MSELLKVARRNLRQYLFKASFSSAVDKQAAFSCLDVIEKELDAAREERLKSAHGQPVVDVEATREVFEKWLMKRHGFGIERWADSGEYRYHNTKEFWECWKLALTGATP